MSSRSLFIVRNVFRLISQALFVVFLRNTEAIHTGRGQVAYDDGAFVALVTGIAEGGVAPQRIRELDDAGVLVHYRAHLVDDCGARVLGKAHQRQGRDNGRYLGPFGEVGSELGGIALNDRNIRKFFAEHVTKKWRIFNNNETFAVYSFVQNRLSDNPGTCAEFNHKVLPIRDKRGHFHGQLPAAGTNSPDFTRVQNHLRGKATNRGYIADQTCAAKTMEHSLGAPSKGVQARVHGNE